MADCGTREQCRSCIAASWTRRCPSRMSSASSRWPSVRCVAVGLPSPPLHLPAPGASIELRGCTSSFLPLPLFPPHLLLSFYPLCRGGGRAVRRGGDEGGQGGPHHPRGGTHGPLPPRVSLQRTTTGQASLHRRLHSCCIRSSPSPTRHEESEGGGHTNRVGWVGGEECSICRGSRCSISCRTGPLNLLPSSTRNSPVHYTHTHGTHTHTTHTHDTHHRENQGA
jgi:hypothetical protein